MSLTSGFRHGVHPPEEKELTNQLPIRRMPYPDEIVLPLRQHASLAIPMVAYRDYEGVALHEEEKPRLQANLGMAKSLILRNHGLLTVGRNIPEAFFNMYFLEMACRIQIDALSSSEVIHIGPGPMQANLNISKVATAGQGPGIAWPALMRKVERMDPGYKS